MPLIAQSFLIAGSVLLMLAVLFRPRRGFLWRWRRLRRDSYRILIEDALKHLYDQEYKNLTCTISSLSGTLGISRDEAAKLLARLEALGLVRAQAEGFSLTAEGRTYALRMIRIHRLWERYLADQTSLEETEWHRKAEILEHNMTDADLDALIANTGDATYDPHGDPIPTSSGKLPPQKGQPLTDLAEGDFARIIHLEDEPDVIYAQLVAEGLHPGMGLRVLSKSRERIQFVADGEEIVLAPVVASNVSVVKIPQEHVLEAPHPTLASLRLGERGEVIGISRACRGQQRLRLMDLGVVPGTVISAEMRSTGGDPIAYNIRGATIALRKQQAEMIQIRPLKEAA